MNVAAVDHRLSSSSSLLSSKMRYTTKMIKIWGNRLIFVINVNYLRSHREKHCLDTLYNTFFLSKK